MVQIFESGNVTKFVYSYDDCVYESVLYKYESYTKRTVMCISVQSGCPVGCIFCGTGHKYIRDLIPKEIVSQVDTMRDYVAQKEKIQVNSRSEKFQIMLMSMGEPMLNWKNVREALHLLHSDYLNAQLLISTIGVHNSAVFQDIIKESQRNCKIGLQFSLHSVWDTERDYLIPYKNKLTVRQIRDYGTAWHIATKRPVYLNFFVSDTTSDLEQKELLAYFSPVVFNLTFSVICNTEKDKEDVNNMDRLHNWNQFFLEEGYNSRIFNPDGQDDIGAGCGQLWYVQNWLKNKKEG